MFYIRDPGLSRFWTVGLLLFFTFVSATPMLTTETKVTWGNKDLLQEFVFSCYTWIPKKYCTPEYSHVMLFNQEGNILEHTRMTNETGKLTAKRKSVNIPKIPKDPSADLSFLFHFIWERNAVMIGSDMIGSDMKILTATDDGKLVMVDKNMSCLPCNQIKDVDLEVLNLACESRGDCAPGSNSKGTIMSQECQEGRWNLVKKGIFLEIRNAKDESKRLKFSGSNLIVDSSGELFTGIDTNFRTGYHLDKSNTNAPKPKGIPDKAYGDVVIEYQDREGKPQESFVCDYMWDEADSSTLCSQMNYAKSIPTFNGEYSSPKSFYAISGVDCDKNDENFIDCSLKVGENSNNKLLQNNMETFGGEGYVCSMNKNVRDVGGVICGSVGQITELRKNDTKCQQDLRQTGTPGQMFSLEKQVRKFSDKMSEDKHWSEFLLPIPLSVTLLASVLLTSTNLNRSITLEKPVQGFEFLKYSSLEGNLVFVSNNIAESFYLSNTEMIAVKLESENIHRSLGKIVKYAYKRQSTTNVRKVKKYLKKMSESASLQVNHVDKIIESFIRTNSILNELTEVLGDTDSFTSEQKRRINQFVKINKKQNEVRKEKLKQLKKEYKEKTKKTKEAETIFFERAEQLSKERCIAEGSIPCKNCTHQENLVEKLDGKPVCDVDPITVCDKWGREDGDCKNWGKVCTSWAGIKHFAICNNWDKKCLKWDQKTECLDYDTKFCPRFKYRPAGSYCVEGGSITANLCGKCNHAHYVLDDMENMTKFTSKILKNVLNKQPQNDEIVSFLNTNLQRFDNLTDSLQEYQLVKDAYVEQVGENDVSITQNEENQEPFTNSKGSSTEKVKDASVEKVDKNNVSNTPNEEDQKPSSNSEESSTANSTSDDIDEKLKKKKNNLISMISAIKPLLQTYEQLFGNKNKDEERLTDFCQKILKTLGEISKGLKGHDKDVEVKDFIQTLKSVYDEGQRLHNDLVKMKANDSPTPEATGMKKLGKEFLSYQKSYLKRAVLEKDLSSLSQKMEDSIEEILAKEFEGSDLDAVIVYLRETSTQLTHISSLWTELRSFFTFVAKTVKRTQIHASNAKEDFFDEIEDTLEETYATIDNLELDKDTLEELKESTVAAMAYNSYTYRIAKFYSRLMVGSGKGLLAKLKLVPNDRNKFRGAKYDEAEYKKYKMFLKKEARATQEQIKDEISREEQVIHKRLAEYIKNIENQFACALEDAKTEDKMIEALEFFSTTSAVKNRAENEKNNIPTVKMIETPEPTLELDTDFGMD